ncbi:MAG: MBL fold metallo-hydrolase [Clostridia bacterium]|nr:MBL fold metallo-hydrolase [Clostridia bacterium]
MNITQLILGPLKTNCYIVYGKDNKAAVIDPAANADIIEDKLNELGLKLDKILLTHAHFDHIMAVDDLRKSGAELYIHKEDLKMLNDPNLNHMLGATGKEIEFENVEHLLADGDIIEIGGEELRVLHTPGHTQGSVCYISDSWIVSGDTLFKETVGRTDLYGGSFDAMLGSMKKIRALEKDYAVYPGHGESTTLNYEKNNNIYMKTLR